MTQEQDNQRHSSIIKDLGALTIATSIMAAVSLTIASASAYIANPEVRNTVNNYASQAWQYIL